MPLWSECRRLGRSFRCAFVGIVLAWRTQGNLRLHGLAVLIVTGLGLWLDIATWEWCVLLLCFGLVLTTELLNTALEILSDRVTRERDELIRMAKDVAAAAVLCAAVTAGITGLIIFLPKLGHLIPG